MPFKFTLLCPTWEVKLAFKREFRHSNSEMEGLERENTGCARYSQEKKHDRGKEMC